MDTATQMRLDMDVQNLSANIPQCVDLFMSGLYWLTYLARNKSKIRFSHWVNLLNDARADSKKIDKEILEWLWETVTSEPSVQSSIGDIIVTLDEEWKNMGAVECLPKKSEFGIFFKGFDSMGYPIYPIPSSKEPDAKLEILAPLCMSPGKSCRLKCQDVPGLLRLKIQNMGSIEEEAAALKMDKHEIAIKDSRLFADVKSLNHAYTKASLRLEPHRRSHGGRVYDHIALLQNDKYIPLETIRRKNEEKCLNQLLGSESDKE